jgi:hypothetical protein
MRTGIEAFCEQKSHRHGRKVALDSKLSLGRQMSPIGVHRLSAWAMKSDTGRHKRRQEVVVGGAAG